MLLDLKFLVDHLAQVLVLVIVISLGKGLIFGGIVRLFSYRNVIPLAVGLGLFQLGEFSFVLARVGVSTGSIGHDLYSLFLTTAILTMALTPLVSGQTARLYSAIQRKFRHEPLEALNLPEKGLEGHVIIAGGGRVGSQVASTIQRVGIAFVIIELDHYLVEKTRADGMPVIYGDASHELVLEAAKIGSAGLLVVTTPDMITTQSIILTARRLKDGIEVVARTSDQGFLEAFSEMGVTDVVLPEFETGLEMARQTLMQLGVPASEVQQQTESLRRDLFEPFFGPAQKYRTLSELRSAEGQFDFRWVSVPVLSPLEDRTIGETRIREVTGASVVGVLREGKLRPNPDPDFRFRAGDLAAVIGTEASLQAFGQLASL